MADNDSSNANDTNNICTLREALVSQFFFIFSFFAISNF